MASEECIFCKIATNGNSEEVIYENDNFFSIPDANPKLKGHSLVISKKHFENVLDLPPSTGQELLDCIKNTAVKILKKLNAEGFNVVNNNFPAAGQIINHVHFHILPRNKNDGFKLNL